ncbi:MAG TPA: hypothetical protein VKS22_07125 [Candidatus Binataceae bacterium]|nr:hypothetical protein [Candidatus Binataceae bacterium]
MSTHVNRSKVRTSRAILFVTLLAASAAGCVAFQTGDTNPPDPVAMQKLEAAVPTYEQSWLANHDDFVQVGELDAYLCNRGVIGTRSNDEVINVLRQKAQAMGANGLTGISCGNGPTDDLNGCNASIACSATALKVVTPASAAN